ncbi:trypsin-like peptidase domain-containing protein [Arcticibacterium luteifluviistationis]|uniref:Serine protease n=1 Tax=Arcticibacterium luteifluviistationis TaxID=1784714 RepID=A0A2Z4GAK6_9BACT|nr:trypsin-like peptidase domain-containing protein [Arcticibacterium luteifluviistationis]AWV98174.1 hypothetical protein DJ013_08310 [Arcticibacterium luteifluviistationis]
MATIHENSLKCVRIEMLAEITQAHLSWASGFFCSWKGKTFLITNWHVVTLKNFQTKETLHPSGAVPGFFNLHYHSVIKENGKIVSNHEAVSNKLELYQYEIHEEEKVYTNQKWVEHPTLGNNVDIVAIELSDKFVTAPYELVTFDIESELQKDKTLQIMDNLFVTGFPLNTSTTPNKYPIYKSATIASEPDVFSELPIFYVDGKTKAGMSGSPVIKKDDIIKKSVTKTGIHLNQGRIELAGIYSGRDRQEEDEHMAELGIVWRYQECLIPILEKAYSH